MDRRDFLRAVVAGTATAGCTTAGPPGDGTAKHATETREPRRTGSDSRVPQNGETRSRPAGSPRRNAGEASAWPQFGHDAAHTGANLAAAGPTEAPSERWSFEPEPTLHMAVVVADGIAYVGSGGMLYALDAATGAEQWSIEWRGNASPAVDGGTVIVPGGGASILALDASTGDRRWETDVGGEPWQPVTLLDDAVFGGTRDRIVALGADRGEVRWTAESPGMLSSPLAAAGERLFVIETQREEVPSDACVAFDARTGDRRWSFPLEQGHFPMPSPAAANGSVYLPTATGRIVALDAATGEERWSADLAGEWRPGLAVAQGIVHVAVTNPSRGGGGNGGSSDETRGFLYALDAGSGRQRWRRVVTGTALTPGPTVVDGTAYTGTLGAERALRAFDTADGADRWTHDLPGEMVLAFAPPVADATLFACAEHHGSPRKAHVSALEAP